MATTMRGPAATAKARTRTPVQYFEPLPEGLYRAIAADEVEVVDRVQLAHSKSRRAVMSAVHDAKKGAAQLSIAVKEAPLPSRESIAAAARDSANSMGVDKASGKTETGLGMQQKKKQRLLEKGECRPYSEWIKSVPVGVAALISAPKLSDFKDGSADERVRQHAAAFSKWQGDNFTSKGIEYETRVR